MKKKVKFALSFGVILVSLGWLAVSGFQESKFYYFTVGELGKLGSRALGMRLKVLGDVVPGSIARREGVVYFSLSQEGSTVKVVYIGRDPLPDTFTDGAQAVVEGALTSAGLFEGRKVQAKCASKYQATYGESPPR